MNAYTVADSDPAGPRVAGRVHVRWMIRRDIKLTQSIERAASPRPWTEAMFLHCLRQRNCIGMVAERDERVIGYMLYELSQYSLHLLNFAVDPASHRKGVGGVMMAKLLGKLRTHRRYWIELVVGERNLTAQLFFRKYGFKARWTIADYFHPVEEGGEYEDGIRMEVANPVDPSTDVWEGP